MFRSFYKLKAMPADDPGYVPPRGSTGIRHVWSLFLMMAMIAGLSPNVIAQVTTSDQHGSNVDQTNSFFRPDWSGENNVNSANNNAASVSPSSFFNVSEGLEITGFDFSAIPANATIQGVTLKIRRNKSGGGNNRNIQDNSVRLYYNNNPTGSDYANTSSNWPTTNNGAWATYGGSSDAWGTSLTRAMVTSSGFGAYVEVKRSGSNNQDPNANIFEITMSITYSVPNPDITASPNSVTISSTVYGTPSASQSFNVSGSDLSAAIHVAAPAGYEVSADGNSYSNTVDLTPTSGSVASTPVYVRTTATAPVNVAAGNIALTSTGATEKDVAVSATVSAKELTISGLTGNGKPYDGNTTATVSGTAVLNGVIIPDNVTLSGTAVYTFDSKDVGTRNITVSGYTLTGADKDNYSLAMPTGLTGTITAIPVTITGLTGNDKTYDGTTDATVSGTPSLSGVISPDVVTVDNSSATFVYDGPDASLIPHTITASGFVLGGADMGNYTLDQPTGLSGIINPFPVTVTFDDTMACYGQTIAASGNTGWWTSTALVGTDAIASVNLGVSPAGGLDANAAGGSYTVTPSNATLSTGNSSNYAFTYDDGTLARYDHVFGSITGAANQQLCNGIAGSVNITLNGGTQFPAVDGNYTGKFKITNLTNTGAAPEYVDFTTSQPVTSVNIPTAKIGNTTTSAIQYDISWESLSNDHGCEGVPGDAYDLTGHVVITVYPLPQLTIASATQSPICSGSGVSIDVNGNGVTGANYRVNAAYNGIGNSGVYGDSTSIFTYSQNIEETLTNNGTALASASYQIIPITDASNGSCRGTAQTVVIDVQPEVTYAGVASSDDSVCLSDLGAASLTISGLLPNTQNTINYTLSSGGTEIETGDQVFMADNSGNVILPFSALTNTPDPGTYTLVINNVNANNCDKPITTNNSVTVTITTPTFAGISADADVCENDLTGGITLSGLADYGDNVINYTLSDGTNTLPGSYTVAKADISGGSVTLPYSLLSTPAPGTYMVTITSIAINGCDLSINSNNQVTVTIHPKPVFTFSINGDQIANNGVTTICQAANTVLDLQGTPGDNWSIEFNDSSGYVPYASSTDPGGLGPIGANGTHYEFVSGLGTAGDYRLVVTSEFGCSDTLTYHINVNPKPEFVFNVNGEPVDIDGTATICQATSTTISLTNATDGYTYSVVHTWVDGNGDTQTNNSYASGTITNGGAAATFISGGNSVTPAVNPANEPTAGDYIITITNPTTGCITTRTFHIYVNPKPEFVFNVNGNPVAIDGTATICQAAPTTISLTNATDGYSYSVSHTWVDGNGTPQTNNSYASGTIENGGASASFISGGNSVNPAVNPANEPTAGDYTITVTNPTTGCITTRTFHIYVNPKPTLDTVYQVAPVCSGTPASIKLEGLLSNMDFTATYAVNNDTSTTTGTADAQGGYSFDLSALPYAYNGAQLNMIGLQLASTGCTADYSQAVSLKIDTVAQPYAAATYDTTVYSPADNCDKAVDFAIDASIYNNGGSDITDLTFSFSGATSANPISTSGTGLGQFQQVFSKGISTVYVQATNDCGANLIDSFTVTVIDNVKPVITFVNDTVKLNVGAGANCTVPMPDYTGSAYVSLMDNCTAAPTIAQLAPNGIGTDVVGYAGYRNVVFKVTDESGNIAYDTLVVKLVDTTAPVAIAGHPTIYLNQSGAASITATAVNDGSYDNCPLNQGVSVQLLDNNAAVSELNFDCSNLGDNTVYLVATDPFGNKDTTTGIVTVIDNISPVIDNNVTVTANLYKDEHCTNKLGDFTGLLNGHVTDNCSMNDVTFSQYPDSTTIIAANQPSVVVHLVAKDASGNADTVVLNVTITDTTAPAFVYVPADTVVYIGSNCDAALTWIKPLSSDNCDDLGLPTVTRIDAGSANGEAGTYLASTTPYTVTYRATDAAGNSRDTSFTVTVMDTTRPVFTNTPGLVTVYTGEGAATCDAVATWDIPQASDCNLNSDSIWSNYPSGSTFAVGTTTIKYVAYDNYGNVSDTLMFDVEVIDNTLPTVAAIDDIMVTPNAAGCSAEVAVPDATVNDNCGVASVAWSVTGATVASGSDNVGTLTFETGMSHVTYVVTDIHGNIDSAAFDVNVVSTLTATISGTSTVVQNASTTSTVTFTANGGTAPYTFYYTVNGGAIDSITTSSTITTVAQSNAALGAFEYKLVEVKDAYCDVVYSQPAAEQTVTITIVAPGADLTPYVSMPSSTFSSGSNTKSVNFNIYNVGTTSFTGNVYFYIIKPTAGFTLQSTSSDWAITDGDGYWLVESTSSQSIQGNYDLVTVPAQLEYTGTSKGVFNLTVTIGNDPAPGDSNSENNTTVKLINVSQ